MWPMHFLAWELYPEKILHFAFEKWGIFLKVIPDISRYPAVQISPVPSWTGQLLLYGGDS